MANDYVGRISGNHQWSEGALGRERFRWSAGNVLDEHSGRLPGLVPDEDQALAVRRPSRPAADSAESLDSSWLQLSCLAGASGRQPTPSAWRSNEDPLAVG